MYCLSHLESERPGTSGMMESFLWGEVGCLGDPPGAGDGTSSNPNSEFLIKPEV